MPLTSFQSQILLLLARNRSPESYVAGGVALNARENIRLSSDVDFFHDAEEAVIRSSDKDCATLREAAFSLRHDLWTPSFRRVWAERGGESLRLEWAQDSAWRFFPVVADEILGWKLHRFDALTNKALAMGARSETRDLVDLVANSGRHSLHSLVWAACAKDPGYGPLLLLNQMRRNSRINPVELEKMGAAFTPVELKVRWLELAETANGEIERAARAGIEPAVAFLDAQGQVVWFDAPSCQAHHAALGGSLPRITGLHYEP